MNPGVFPPKVTALFSAAIIALSSLSPVSVSAQFDAPAATRIVKQVDVVFDGPVTVDEARIRAQMSTREGTPFRDEAVERDIRNLYATGAVENVDIRAVNVAGGVKVTVVVSGRGAIGEIGFLGNMAFSNEKLRKEIEVEVGDPVDDIKLSEAQQAIRETYEKKGFSDVLVTYKTSPSTKPGFTSVIFDIDEGSRGYIGDIKFEGNSVLSSRKLRSLIKSKEKTLWRLWGAAGKFNSLLVREDVKIIEGAYQDEGYVYAKVTDIRKEPASSKKVDLIYVISEGEKYDVASVDLEGVTIFSKEELEPAIRAEAGFQYSGSDIKGDEEMIKDYYGARGYADAFVDTSILSAGPNLVKIVYRVTEGTKSYIRKVNIAGNTVTQDRVIRRELPFAPGEELNTVKMKIGKERLNNLNYFSEVDFRNNPTGVEGFKDVDVTVTEQSTGTVNFGAGFSSIDSLVGFIDLTQTNFDLNDWPSFRGAGQRFNMSLRLGLQRRDFNMSFTEPWFLGQKLAFTVGTFYRDLFFLSDRFDQQNFGANFGLRKPMGEFMYVEGTLTIQQTRISNIQPGSSAIIAAEAGSYAQAKFDLALVHDTRDSVFITRRGHKLEAGLMASGGDVEVYGASFSGQQFFSLPFDSILSLRGEANVVDNYGGGRVPIFERQFLGGANNLRGFDFREVGPKDATGEPIGGNVSIFGSIEYTFPIIEKVRGALFYDVGSISGDLPAVVGDGDINSNVGLGLRLFLPVGPIRVDYGIPVESDRFNDNSGRFQFNMGYQF